MLLVPATTRVLCCFQYQLPPSAVCYLELKESSSWVVASLTPSSFYPPSSCPPCSSISYTSHLLSHCCPSSLLPHPRPILHLSSQHLTTPPSPLSLPCESTDSSSSFSCGKSFSKTSTSLTPSPCPQWHNTAWWRSEGGGGTSSEKLREVSKLLLERVSTPVKPLF